ncbi:MAG: c-type cytochrome [Xanthobacteraceae bacterium]|jgi:cytochrome c
MPNKESGLAPWALFVTALGFWPTANSHAAAAANADHGKVVFQNCAACHSDKPGAIGPSLRGVVGRKSGSVEGFHYSGAMAHANLTWDEANLRDYIANPQAKVRGNRMPYGGLANPSDLDDLIAYLKDYK